MKAETKKQLSEAKSMLKKNGRPLAGYLFTDCFGDDGECLPHSRKVTRCIEAAEEQDGGIKRIYANYNDQIVIES